MVARSSSQSLFRACRFFRPLIPQKNDPRYVKIAKAVVLSSPPAYLLDRNAPFLYDRWRLQMTESPTSKTSLNGYSSRCWTPPPEKIVQKIRGNSFKPPEGRTQISVDDLTSEQIEEMRQSSEFLPNSVDDLVYIQVQYLDFSGRKRIGELVCHRLLSDKIVRIFEKVYEKKFPIQRMRLIEDYGTDDDSSMVANNTSAFFMRSITNKPWKWSKHSGLAFDINPFYNPYVHSKYGVAPKSAEKYADRSIKEKGTITEDIIQIWKDEGFIYGGDWNEPKDWHHFEFPIELLQKLKQEKRKTFC